MKFTPQTHQYKGIATWIGEDVDYVEAWAYQEKLRLQRAENLTEDRLIFLSHSAVYTLGRRIDESHVLSKLDAPLIETDRGGFITYHGPGQLIGYPVVDLKRLNIGPRRYVLALENALIRTLNDYGLNAYKHGKNTGVWTEKGKIASIGVKMTNGITTHGFALNVNPDLNAFKSIIACGLIDVTATSMAKFCINPELKSVAKKISSNLGKEINITWHWD